MTIQDQIIEVEAVPVIDLHTQEALKEFTASDAWISELASRAKGLTIEGPDDKEGHSAVSTLRKEAKGKRVEVRKVKERLNAPALKHQRAVNAEAERITDAILVVEGPLSEMEKKADAEKAERKAEEALAAKAVLDDRVAALQAVGGAVPVSTVADWSAEQFVEMLGEYTERYEAAVAAQAELDAREAQERADDEAKAEAARLAEEAERAAKDAAAKAEREAAEAKLVEERKTFEAEKAAAQVERDKIATERREIEQARLIAAAKAEALEGERLRAEQEKRAAELKAEREAELTVKREMDAADLKAKQDAARPDADRIRSISADLANYELPQAAWTNQVRMILSEAESGLDELADCLDGGVSRA